jgi:hypothetical protein
MTIAFVTTLLLLVLLVPTTLLVLRRVFPPRRTDSARSEEAWTTGVVLSARPVPHSRFPFQIASIRLPDGTCVEADVFPGSDAPLGQEVKIRVTSYYSVSSNADARAA